MRKRSNNTWVLVEPLTCPLRNIGFCRPSPTPRRQRVCRVQPLEPGPDHQVDGKSHDAQKQANDEPTASTKVGKALKLSLKNPDPPCIRKDPETHGQHEQRQKEEEVSGSRKFGDLNVLYNGRSHAVAWLCARLQQRIGAVRDDSSGFYYGFWRYRSDPTKLWAVFRLCYGHETFRTRHFLSRSDDFQALRAGRGRGYLQAVQGGRLSVDDVVACVIDDPWWDRQ